MITRKQMNRIVSVLSASSDQTASASSQSLAQGVSEQAASLEETSSAINEMASMIKKNSDTSDQANALCFRKADHTCGRQMARE